MKGKHNWTAMHNDKPTNKGKLDLAKGHKPAMCGCKSLMGEKSVSGTSTPVNHSPSYVAGVAKSK